MGLSRAKEDNLRAVRGELMPGGLPRDGPRGPDRSVSGPGPGRDPGSHRSTIWHVSSKDLDSWVLPFIGADKSVIDRTQFREWKERGEKPVVVQTYFAVSEYTGFERDSWFSFRFPVLGFAGDALDVCTVRCVQVLVDEEASAQVSRAHELWPVQGDLLL